MNLADPELELIDPTPNVHTLFIQFDKIFFSTTLACRAVVRWSKRMYSCAGVCSYEGRGGLVDIALSEPLLKLRPRKDLIETLLHEMIHAYLFVTCQDQDRDGHGPNFKSHMYRINKSAGINISIYHDFHDEVKLYQIHWWRCDGPCQSKKPYFGIVRRSQNRAPGPNDYWWSTHQKLCGGKFIKIKEPEKKNKKSLDKNLKKNGDITKYVNNNNDRTLMNNNKLNDLKELKDVAKASGNKIKSNGSTIVVAKKTATVSPIKMTNTKQTSVFSGKGQVINIGRNRTNSADVSVAVRNIWAKKQVPGLTNNKSNIPKRKSMADASCFDTNNSITKPNKQKVDEVHSESPPSKIKKIDEYFKNTASSILKDVYGQDFRLTQSDNKIVASTSMKIDLVACPVCNMNVNSKHINRHLDECLNKDVIEQLSKEIIKPQCSQSDVRLDGVSVNVKQENVMNKDCDTTLNFKTIYGENAFIPNNQIGLTNIVNIPLPKKEHVEVTNFNNKSDIHFGQNDVNKVKAISKKINNDSFVMKSNNHVQIKKESSNVDSEFLPSSSHLDDLVCTVNAPKVRIEAGTSKDTVSALRGQQCACCGDIINKPMSEHLDECLAFFNNNTTTPEEGLSNSFANNPIVIDDDEEDIFDETLTLNATGTKTPCPCCLEMIESAEMNNHLDSCLL